MLGPNSHPSVSASQCWGYMNVPPHLIKTINVSNPPCFLSLSSLSYSWCLDFFLDVFSLVSLTMKWGQHRTEHFLTICMTLLAWVTVVSSLTRGSHVPITSHVIVSPGRVSGFLCRPNHACLPILNPKPDQWPHLPMVFPSSCYSCLCFFSWLPPTLCLFFLGILPGCPLSLSSRPATITHMSSWKRCPHCSSPAPLLHHPLWCFFF